MKLSSLVFDIAEATLTGNDIDVAGIAYDSRRVRQGDLFVAVPGLKTDGAQFVSAALANGASAILCDNHSNITPEIPAIRVANVRKAMAEAAWALFGHPERTLQTCAITGTNGKTTTATILTQLLQANGYAAGMIGTLGVSYKQYVDDGARTTPEAPDLARHMRNMCNSDVTHLVMEATSIGIDLQRIWRLPVAVSVFTNLTRDHLDYHGSEAAYLAAKLRLFSEQDRSNSSVVNADDGAAPQVARAARGSVITYGIGNGDVQAQEVQLAANGSVFDVVYRGQRHRVTSPLLGRFNVSNALAAVTAVNCLGIEFEQGCTALSQVRAAHGRAEVVPASAPFTIIVDYAHTPDALEKILSMVREFGPSEIVAVFGAGGDRDRGKRPLMGNMAARYADRLIVTSDNPRSEDPHTILEEIAAGIPGNTARELIVDRRAAILRAIGTVRPNGVVLIAGKGHETYQETQGVQHSFDDVKVATEILQQLGYRN